MNILLTGHGGFLGKNIVNCLDDTNELITLDRHNANIICDLATDVPNLEGYDRYDCVIHAAGKAHLIPRSEQESEAFFLVNFKGTQNLCKALSKADMLPRSFVFISTVAVYGQDWGTNIDEEAVLKGRTPYAKSKIEAEKWLKEWSEKHAVCLTILRLPLVAGIHPPGNLGAMVNGIKSGRYFRIGRGESKKSIVMAADVAKIIPKASKIGGVYNLTDGYHPSFAELEEIIARQLGKPIPKSIPIGAAKLLGWVGDIIGNRFPVNSDTIKKITSDLTFDDTNAREKLGWAPSKVLDDFKIS